MHRNLRSLYTLWNQPRLTLFALALVTLALSVSPRALAEPGPFTLRYSAENSYLTAGTATLSLAKSEQGWTMTLATKPTRLVRMAGVGKVIETAVLASAEPPFKVSSYSFYDSKRKKKNYSAILSTDENAYVIERHDKNINVPIGEEAIIDRLSATLKIAAQLQVDPQFERVQYKVLEPNGLRDVVFKNLGQQTISVASKQMQCYLVESGRPGSSRVTRTWFAALNNDTKSLTPVRMEQYKKDELTLRFSLIQYSFE
jgi:hypothetical protein